MLTLTDVARELRRARREARTSQDELAAKARVTRSTVSRMETVAKADMSLRVVLRLFAAAGYELRAVRRSPCERDDVPGETLKSGNARDH